jgi:hypothetical protein
LNWLLIFLVSHIAGPADKAAVTLGFIPRTEASADVVLASYVEAAPKNVVRGAWMDVEFKATLPKLDKAASLDARRLVSPSGDIHYEVLKSDGDISIKKEVIARYMSAEMEPPAQLPKDIAISAANYKFKTRYIRERDGRKTFVYEVTPRKKRLGLFKGEIWVDGDTGLVVRESGHLVKSPSVFLKNVHFVREFEVRGGFSIPLKIETIMDTRFWGPAQLVLDFSNFNWNTSLVSTQAGTPSAEAH